MQTIMTSSVLALCCCLLCWIGLGESLDHVMIGAVFTLAPGVPLTNSIRNFLENDYLSGLIRFVDAFLTAGCIAIVGAFRCIARQRDSIVKTALAAKVPMIGV